ncbi:IS66 family insertion sequence element accessory protein TnpA [Virgibacillus doumboii]|uniref:IS66 family insertion sequence element accessory protein TnpA n=1 Tax=Virgibacillus doumboii TaxID=2697503 RepID=UPI0013E06435|nr:IS66 family insertion sequence element accessory protein TnpB [Virgibacillus doumboii]
MTLKDKRIEWKARYDDWKESGQSIAGWCRDQEIKVHQMYYWVQRFEKDMISPEPEATETQWLTVQVDDKPIYAEDQGPIFIHVDTISVEVRPEANIQLLSDVIHILQNQNG